MARPVYFEEPRVARWLFGSSEAAWIWLIVRLWLGWEWLAAGWGKVFGGAITWRVWDWGKSSYGLTGDANIGWIRGGTVHTAAGTVHEHAGDAIVGFAKGAIAQSKGPHPQVAYSWYVDFLKWVRDTGHTPLAYVIAFGEVVVGIALILGLFTGIVAFLGAIMNFSYVFAGAASTNPAMLVAAALLVLAWRNAGWYGLDRFVLPKVGTPWQHAGRGSEAARESNGANPG